MVERVLNVLPQVQTTLISLYSGWMPAFMKTSRIVKAESTLPGFCPMNRRHAQGVSPASWAGGAGTASLGPTGPRRLAHRARLHNAAFVSAWLTNTCRIVHSICG